MSSVLSSSGDLSADRRYQFAQSLAGAGDFAAAADLMLETLTRVPGWAAGWMALGDWAEAAGRDEQAAESFGRVQVLDPADRFGAGLRLDLLRRVPVAEAMPAAFVETLFDQYALRFEASLKDKLDYRGPDLLAAAVPGRLGRVLDLGCGTGLMGQAIAGRCDWLEGWDISTGMLDQARAKRLYDRLEKRDLARLEHGAARWDTILAADVFIYLGALERITAWVVHALAPGGRFAFTVEAGEGAEVTLQPSRRYAHGADYLCGLMADAGFSAVQMDPVTLRQDRGAPVAAYVVTFAVLGGTSSIISGNHWFQGDDSPDGQRTAGLILTSSHNRATITGNYVDNCSIEWTNEHDPEPEYNSEYSFSALSISDNIFQAIGAAQWFKFIVIKPHGAGHFISGLNITGNIFRSMQGNLDRVETIDTSFADMDRGRMRNILVQGNMFNGVEQGMQNPAVIDHDQGSTSATWTVDCAGPLPFAGYAQNVVGVVARSRIRDGGGSTNYAFPYVSTEEGTNRDRVELRWPEALEGTVSLTVRMDNY
jgi:predicted TPR repeat methyltransferase